MTMQEKVQTLFYVHPIIKKQHYHLFIIKNINYNNFFKPFSFS